MQYHVSSLLLSPTSSLLSTLLPPLPLLLPGHYQSVHYHSHMYTFAPIHTFPIITLLLFLIFQDCPETVYKCMLECWTADHRKRPSFTQVVRILEILLEGNLSDG